MMREDSSRSWKKLSDEGKRLLRGPFGGGHARDAGPQLIRVLGVRMGPSMSVTSRQGVMWWTPFTQMGVQGEWATMIVVDSSSFFSTS